MFINFLKRRLCPVAAISSWINWTKKGPLPRALNSPEGRGSGLALRVLYGMEGGNPYRKHLPELTYNRLLYIYYTL